MRRFFGRLLATIGAIVVLVAAAGAGLFLWFKLDRPRIADAIVLTLDLDRGLPEARSGGSLTSLIERDSTPTLREVIEGLDRAGGDKRVKALVVEIGAGRQGLAQTQELRAAIKRFRAQGKPAHVFSDSFGEFGNGTVGYYLAASFDRIILQPTGAVGLTGFYAESPFARRVLDDWAITPRVGRREEFKNAPNVVTETGLTPAHRANLEALVNNLTDQIVRDVAADRKFEPAALRQLIDRAPFDAADAKQARLVDTLGYRDEAVEQALKDAGPDARRMRFDRYLEAIGRPRQHDKRIALINGVGAIVRGNGGGSLFGDPAMGANRIVKAIEDAARDEKVKAIVLRLDTGGGSYIASDTIRRAVEQARAKGKPVVASMGNTAASGGYYVALGADRIIADPATLTGSIGVFAGKLYTEQAWRKLGVNWDGVASGAHADLWTQTRDYAPDERAWLESTLDRIYGEFVGRVAEARQLKPERARELAKGRVWTGAEAKEVGLVDELGGLDSAVKAARGLAKIAADEATSIRVFPRPRSFLRRAFDRLTGEDDEDSRSIEMLAERMAPLGSLARGLGVLGDTGVLSMPVLEIK
jgi:protease IV